VVALLPGAKNGSASGRKLNTVVTVADIKNKPNMPTRKIADIRASLTPIDIDRVVQMAWEDRTPFEAIKVQFGLSEAEVIALMKAEMKLQNWQKWRARVQGRPTKHAALRDGSVKRFKSKMQRSISGNRISKR
jgi:uncharacterized protein (TIGR03643 family)